jgi:hypothetical protein
MELPKFFRWQYWLSEDIFVIHLDYPRFIINLKDDEVEFIEAEDLDETELNAKWRTVVLQMNFTTER